MKKKTKERLIKYRNIVFGDINDGLDFGVSCVSAIFWIWLEVMFLKFFFTFAFGIVGYMIGDYPEAARQVLINSDLKDGLIIVFILIQLILRIKIPLNRKFKGVKK